MHGRIVDPHKSRGDRIEGLRGGGITGPVVELRGVPRGPGPPERPGGPAKHLVLEGTRGPLNGPHEMTRQIHCNMNHHS